MMNWLWQIVISKNFKSTKDYQDPAPATSVVDPDPESHPDPVGSGTFCRIRSRIRNKSFRIRIRVGPHPEWNWNKTSLIKFTFLNQMHNSNKWMRSSQVVRASGCQCQSRTQSWVRSQHPPTRWNLRGAADEAMLNRVTYIKNKKIRRSHRNRIRSRSPKLP